MVSARIPAAGNSPAMADDLEDRHQRELLATATTPEEKLAAEQAIQATSARRQSGRTVRQLGLSFYGLRPDQDLNRPAGEALAPGYLLPFEIISIHLLVVLIGAAYLARAKRRATSGPGVDL